MAAEIKETISQLGPARRMEVEDRISEQALVDTPENIARIQRKLDEVDPSKCREWTSEDWAKLGVHP